MDVKRILVIDDDANVTKTLCRILAAKGYTPVAVHTATAAFAASDEEVPAVALIDQKLQGESGLDFMAEIKKRSPATECIVLTGYASEASAIEAINLGAYSYLVKPYDVEQLMLTIRRATEKQQAARALQKSEERFRTFMETASDLMFIVDGEGHLTYVNAAMPRILGYSKQELIGMPISRLLTEETLSTYEVDLARLVAEGQLYLEPQWLTKSGDRIYGEARVVAVHDDESNFTGYRGVFRDTTERRQAEENLRKLNQFRQSVIDNANVWLDVLDQRGNVLIWNKAAERISGYSREETVGHGKIWEWLYPDEEYRKATTARAVAVIRTGTSIEGFESTIRTKGGEDRIISWNSSSLEDNRGNPAGSFALGRDITERRRAQEALVKTAASLAEAQRIAHVGNWDWNIMLDELRWSDEASRIFGLPPRDFKGTRKAFLASVHPDDRVRVRESVDRALHQGTRQALTYRVVRRDGEVRSVHAQGEVFFDESDKPVRMIGTVRDITEEKRAEEEREQLLAQVQAQAQRMQQIMDTVPAGVVLLGTTGEILLANPAAEGDLRALAGAKVGDTLLHLGGKPLSEILSPPPMGAWHEVASESPPRRIFDVIARPLASGSSDQGFVLILSDETNQRVLQQRIQRHDRLAVVGQLAGAVAHDFNNYLTVIKSYTGFALDDLVVGDPLRADLEEVDHAADRAATLTRQLLAFSHKQVMPLALVDLNDVISDMENMLRRLVGEEVHLHTALAPELRMILADPSRMEQVVLNLATNARDAMPDGGLLTIETRNVYLDEAYARDKPGVKPGAYVQLAVTDTGTGITDEVLEHIFEPFFTTKDTDQGTGLGLATVYGIVTQSGGSIEIESKLRSGTTFRVFMPRATEAAESEEEPEARPEVFGTILVVEAEEVVRQVMIRVLERSGYSVLATASPEEALRLAQSHQGAMDLLMTGVPTTGTTEAPLEEQLRVLHPDIRVLYTSGRPSGATPDQVILERGATMLAKPFTPEELTDKVHALLDRPPQ